MFLILIQIIFVICSNEVQEIFKQLEEKGKFEEVAKNAKKRVEDDEDSKRIRQEMKDFGYV